MRTLIRKLYYKLNIVKIKLHNKKVIISSGAMIKFPKLIDSPCKIGANTYISGKVGSYTYIGQGCRLNADIGKFCSIADNVRTVEANHPLDWVSTSPCFYSDERQCGATFVREKRIDDIVYADKKNKRSCIIGNDVWIGENVLLKGGIKIGDGACIAMGAVVVHDVEPYAVVGGVPAKIIKKRFSDEDINWLLELKWWDKPVVWIQKFAHEYDSIKKFRNEVENN